MLTDWRLSIDRGQRVKLLPNGHVGAIVEVQPVAAGARYLVEVPATHPVGSQPGMGTVGVRPMGRAHGTVRCEEYGAEPTSDEQLGSGGVDTIIASIRTTAVSWSALLKPTIRHLQRSS